jgi:hypothetical protein
LSSRCKKYIIKIYNKNIFFKKNPAIDPKRRRLFETSGGKILPKIQNKCAPPWIFWNAKS